jgi:cardiolipin synthase
MVRVTGDVVRQAQVVFFASFGCHGGPIPADLSPYFREQPDAGSIPATIVQVVPGGFVSATQSVRAMIDNAQERVDIMNPYFTDRDMVERAINAAERGVAVRMLASQRSNSFVTQLASRHNYGDLIDAGVEIWEYPEAVVHAKVIVADDHVLFGTVNLDTWALERNFEVAVVAESGEAATLLQERVFEPDIAQATRGVRPTGVGSAISWLFDKFSWFI